VSPVLSGSGREIDVGWRVGGGGRGKPRTVQSLLGGETME